MNFSLTSEIETSFFIAEYEVLLMRLYDELPKEIDIIHAEQPWMWSVVRWLIQKEKCQGALLVNGTQNVEYEMKAAIFNAYGVNDSGFLEAIRNLELDACRESDLTLAVTEKDLTYFKKHCDSFVGVLAPNGISPWLATEQKLDEWKPKLPSGPWILYIASAHPPNYTGFVECIGDSLACLPPDGRLVVAGGVSQFIYQALSETRFATLNLSRVQLLFELDDEDLCAIKSLAPAFLLPIVEGGGSNLKTAEALWSGAWVIGSEYAFRGFEQYMNEERVSVCRNPTEFQQAIYNLTQKNTYQNWIRPRRENLTWDTCLSRFTHAVAEMKTQRELNK